MERSDDRSSRFSIWASSNPSSRSTGRRSRTDITPRNALHRNPQRIPTHEEHRAPAVDEHRIASHREYWQTVMQPPESGTRPSSSSHHGSRYRNQEMEEAHTGGSGSMRHGTQVLQGAQGGQHSRTRQSSTTPPTARIPEYSCTSCGASFSTSAQLSSHVEAHHRSSRPHTCDRCDMTFSQKSHLKQHIKTVHEKYRPFKCRTCSREFGKRYDCSAHERAVHENVKEHSCKLCGKAFAKRSNLNRHIINLHSDESGGSSSGSSRHQQPPPL